MTHKKGHPKPDKINGEKVETSTIEHNQPNYAEEVKEVVLNPEELFSGSTADYDSAEDIYGNIIYNPNKKKKPKK